MSSPDWLLPSPDGLPFNRKERYYTGTVLPGIVAGCELGHLHLFLELCGLDPSVTRDPANDDSEVQFFTEYGFAESVTHDDEWDDYAGGRDTPDVVIAGPNWLVAVEAKMYANQGAASLEVQTQRQQELVDLWAATLGIVEDNAKLVYLLPGDYAATLTGLTRPVVTWEQVIDAYEDVGSRYWLDVLRQAIDRYPQLVATGHGGGTNSDAMLTGEEIVSGIAEGTLEYSWIGRRGGRSGAAFQADCSSGGWRTHRYEVRESPPEESNPNWWPIADFPGDVGWAG